MPAITPVLDEAMDQSERNDDRYRRVMRIKSELVPRQNEPEALVSAAAPFESSLVGLASRTPFPGNSRQQRATLIDQAARPRKEGERTS
jgi:hypothetical protein